MEAERQVAPQSPVEPSLICPPPRTTRQNAPSLLAEPSQPLVSQQVIMQALRQVYLSVCLTTMTDPDSEDELSDDSYTSQWED